MSCSEIAGTCPIVYGSKRFSGRALSSFALLVATFFMDVLVLLVSYKIAPVLAVLFSDVFGLFSTDTLHNAAYPHVIAHFAISIGVIASFFVGSHYTSRIPWWSQMQLVSKIISLAMLVNIFVIFVLGLGYSKILVFANWGTVFALLVLFRFVLNRIKAKVKSWRVPTVIIGDVATVTDTLYAMDSDKGVGFDPQMILLRDKDSSEFDREELPSRYKNISLYDGLEGYEEFIKAHMDCLYVIALEAFRGERRELLLNTLHKNGVDFAIVPSISQVSSYHKRPLYFFGNDVMMLRSGGKSQSYVDAFLKRAMDIVGAVVGLTLLGFPMLLVAVALKVEGQGGTVLYGGMRVGQKGKLFKCWKFRSMEPNTDHLLEKYIKENPEAKAEWDRYFKLSNDPRVQTRTSRFIRKASVDELPQLWNVLKGDMSLVGPRPILENEIEAYGDKVDEYKRLKPGVTGLWQVSGRNGTSFQRRVLWDSWYAHNRSLWGDIVIILKTVYVVLNRSGAH